LRGARRRRRARRPGAGSPVPGDELRLRDAARVQERGRL